jgi:hypothetical protein
MVKRALMPMAPVIAVLLVATAAGAQEPLGCPVIEEEAGTPVELRIGDFVLRAQVTGDAGETGESTRVQGRLIGCERDRRIGATGDEADAGDAELRGLASVLRVLHDLRIGLELGPAREGRCVRAQLEVSDAAGGVAGTAGERPVAVELCGFPFSRDSGTVDRRE